MNRISTSSEKTRRNFRLPPAKGLPRRQQGFTLLLGMVLILVMTVFGIFALNNSIMQSRMAGNFQDEKVSFEGAELGLRWGETFLQSRTPAQRPFPCQTLADDPNDNCANPRQVLAAGLLVNDSAVTNDDVEERNPWDCGDQYWQNARYFGEDPNTASVCGTPDFSTTDPVWDLRDAARGNRSLADQPRLMMEEAFVDRDDLAGNPQQGRIFYRVYAASTGERPTTISILQSSVAKRFQ
ncbi:MAG: PilX N-terminal domain-containing pilus assembly protein [Xanthomonadales bacterium]|nr:PilX N-terminal domain-containing pilus assembly protein [Xanthomonadales bacterium]